MNTSDDNLEVLLIKATNLKKVGRGIAIAGSISVLVGVGVGYSAGYYDNWPMAYAAVTLFLGGLTADLVGIPLLFLGSSREKRVNSYTQGLTQTPAVKITPCTLSYGTRDHTCPGIRINISF